MLGHVTATHLLTVHTILLDDRTLKAKCLGPDAKVVNYPLGVVFF